MYFATNQGALEFDGRNWSFLPGQGAVYALTVTDSGSVYWAGARGFGKINPDRQGAKSAVLTSESSERSYFALVQSANSIFLLGENVIEEFDLTTRKHKPIQFEGNETFLNLFELSGRVFATTESQKVYAIENGKLAETATKIPWDVVFVSRYEDDYVIGTAENRLYAVNRSLQVAEIVPEDKQYIEAGKIISGVYINRQLLALGTLRGGVIFLNPITGTTQEIINYHTGLPDNETFALAKDANMNIWTAHDYGFTKISPYLPFKSFAHYQGLSGNLLCTLSTDTSMYVGTSQGVFKLKRENLYEELTYFVEVEIKESIKSKTSTAPTAEPATPPAEVNDQPRKGGVFAFLRRKARKQEPAKETTQEPVANNKKEELPANSPVKRFRREKRVEKVLRSSQYVFKKVEGIDSKVLHLREFQGKVFAAGLGGVAEVSDLRSRTIFEEPVRFLFASKERSAMVAVSYDDAVLALQPNGDTWRSIPLAGASVDVDFIFEGDGNLWMCSPERLYKASLDDSVFRVTESKLLVNPNLEPTLGVITNQGPLLVNNSGFYRYVASSDSTVRVDSLPAPTQYFATRGRILFREQNRWAMIGEENLDPNFQLLNLFSDLRYVSLDARSGGLWMISGGNDLFKFYADKLAPAESTFPIMLRSMINNDRPIPFGKKVYIDELSSALSLEFVQPDFVNPGSIEFRYQLQGMNTEWSEWSVQNNKISFPYLPVGEYKLHVQGRNIFGRVTELEPIEFEVLPPYWQRSWFYALEFLVFSLLVALSFRLNRRFRIVSRVLSLLTIILLIELIQSAINSMFVTKESPVSDFVVQVVVALMVLPVEGYLRQFMLRSLDSGARFYSFLSPQGEQVRKTEEKETKEG